MSNDLDYILLVQLLLFTEAVMVVIVW